MGMDRRIEKTRQPAVKVAAVTALTLVGAWMAFRFVKEGSTATYRVEPAVAAGHNALVALATGG